MGTRGRPGKMKDSVHIGFQLERTLWDKFAVLARRADVSMSFAIRRGIIDMVNTNRIPMNSEIEQPKNDEFETADLEAEQENYSELRQQLLELQQKLEQIQQKPTSFQMLQGQPYKPPRKTRAPVNQPG